MSPPRDIRGHERLLPVLIGYNYEHVMGKAQIFRKPNGEILIQVVSEGEAGHILGQYLEQAEPIAVSFTAIPALNAREKRVRD